MARKAHAKARPGDLLQWFLESDTSKYIKILALKDALASLEAEKCAEDRAISSRRVGSQLLEIMDQVDWASLNGKALSLKCLRLNVPCINRTDFDAAVIDLATDGLVDLHRYGWPTPPPEDEKADMVPDGRGGYFCGIVRRAPVAKSS